jgi:nitrogen fixation/metabolism regulation signal transduction histidine kinase
MTGMNPEVVPVQKRDQFAKLTKEWNDTATQLQDASQAKDQDKTAAAFTKLYLVIKQMSVE